MVARLNAECRAFLADPTVRAAMEVQGMIADPTTPEAFAAFIHAEVVKWGAMVRAAGVRLE